MATGKYNRMAVFFDQSDPNEAALAAAAGVVEMGLHGSSDTQALAFSTLTLSPPIPTDIGFIGSDPFAGTGQAAGDSLQPSAAKRRAKDADEEEPEDDDAAKTDDDEEKEDEDEADEEEDDLDDEADDDEEDDEDEDDEDEEDEDFDDPDDDDDDDYDDDDEEEFEEDDE